MSPSVRRMTLSTQLLLRAMLEHPDRATYGLELCNAAGLASGTIHPILARLEGLGWVTSEWEDVDPNEVGRPRRRYYRLSPDGIEKARDALDRARTPVTRLSNLRTTPKLGGGIA